VAKKKKIIINKKDIDPNKTYEKEVEEIKEILNILVSGYSKTDLTPENFPKYQGNEFHIMVNTLAHSYSFYMRDNNVKENTLYKYLGFNKNMPPIETILGYLCFDISKIYPNRQDFLYYNMAMNFQLKIINTLTPILSEIQQNNEAFKKNYIKGVIFSFHELFQEGIQIIKLKNTIDSPHSDSEVEKYIKYNEGESDNIFTVYKNRKFSWSELIYGLSDLNRHKHEIDQALKDYTKVMKIEDNEKKEKSFKNWKRRNRSLYRMEAYYQKDFMNIPMQNIDVEGMAQAIDILNIRNIDLMISWFVHRFQKETKMKLTKLVI